MGHEPPSDPAMGSTDDSPASAHAADEFGLAELLAIIRDERRIFVIAIAVCLGGAVALALYTDPIYRAQTVLIPASSGSDGAPLSRLASQYGSLASLAGISLSGDPTLKSESLATLESRAFLEEFIRERKLLPVIFADEWDAPNARWKTTNEARQPTIADAARVLGRRIMDVSEDRKTGLITLSIDWTDREMAARWANEIVARLNEHMRSRAIREAEQSITQLERELGQTDAVEVRQGIYMMIEREIGKKTVANVRQEFALRTIDPALTPTLMDKIRPKRLLMAIGGLGIGATLAMFLALIKRTIRRQPPRPRSAS